MLPTRERRGAFGGATGRGNRPAESNKAVQCSPENCGIGPRLTLLRTYKSNALIRA